jgi:hypothetical protein
MIHVDVKRDVIAGTRFTRNFLVQTSVDGGPWTTQYWIPMQVGEKEETIKEHADHIARVFAHGIRFAGGEARATSCGYGL